MAKSDLFLAFNEITETHHLSKEVVIDALRQTLVSAYQKDSGIGKNQPVVAEIDPAMSKYTLFAEKEVVEEVQSAGTEISLEDARNIDSRIRIGDMVMAPVETNTATFGRIAAQTAKQVILQKIREAERKSLYDEYRNREGDLINGTVQGRNNQNLTLNLGRAEAIMPANQQIRNEKYNQGDKIRAFVLEVRESNRGPQIIVSRSHKNMLRRLLEYEVPEIYNGQVEIRMIAREAGHRSKVAVAALQTGVDPVGACVGMKGQRIQNIVNELNGEKIDVIEWNTDPKQFIAKSLSPARVSGVYLEQDIDLGDTATVIVPDDQLSLAIGREGQNARLAAKLTNWRIDIKSVSEAALESFAKVEDEPLVKLKTEFPDMMADVERIVTKKREARAVTPEEYMTLTRFVQMAEDRLLATREESRGQRRKAMDRVRPAVPPFAFTMALDELELASDIMNAIKTIPNVGELMVRVLADEENLQVILTAARAGNDAMDAIREAIDSLVLARQEELESAANAKAEQAAATSATDTVATSEAPALVNPDGTLAEALTPVVEEDGDALPAFIDVDAPPAPRNDAPSDAKPIRRFERPAPNFAKGDDEEDIDITQGGKNKKKEKPAKKVAKGRELVFDERLGEVITRKIRKGSRAEGWEDDEE